MRDPTLGRRERKKLATRRALGEAAIRLALERGLEDIRVEDIADAADVSPRTFNNYFSSKYEAICSLGLDRADRIGDAVRKRTGTGSLWDAIRLAVLGEYRDASAVPDPSSLDRLRLLLTSPPLQGNYLAVTAATQHALAEAIAERTGADLEHDMGPEILAGAVVAATQVALRRWSIAQPPVALQPLVEQALAELQATLSERWGAA
jgi:AcrR family transcriptional regulator